MLHPRGFKQCFILTLHAAGTLYVLICATLDVAQLYVFILCAAGEGRFPGFGACALSFEILTAVALSYCRVLPHAPHGGGY